MVGFTKLQSPELPEDPNSGNLTISGTSFFENVVISGVSTIGVATIGIASVGILSTRASYYISTGSIIGPGNYLNTPSNSLVTIDFSQNMVAIGTIGREPIWNFINVPSNKSTMATITVVGIASFSTLVSMGRTYTVNGGSNKTITWATTSVPNFDSTNWNILTFRFITDDVGISSVFANKD